MAKRNIEEAETIQPAEKQRDLFNEAPTNPSWKYPGTDLESKPADDNRHSPFADPFDLANLLWRSQCQSEEVSDGFWNQGNVSARIDVEQLRHAPPPVNDNETRNRTPNGTKQTAAFFTEGELYFHRRQSTKVSARGSLPTVGVEEGYRRLACRQTVFAFDPNATTSSPTMAIY
ncbi:MAG TPA: hypothetical protein VNM15_00240 [Candidatus Binatia bacterium]|nr:hypothetical protein [Candidatus Binatia bacterium]